VPLVAFLSLAAEIGDLHHPLVQVGETDPVDLTLAEIITEPLVQFHDDVFIVAPVDGGVAGDDLDWLKS